MRFFTDGNWILFVAGMGIVFLLVMREAVGADWIDRPMLQKTVRQWIRGGTGEPLEHLYRGAPLLGIRKVEDGYTTCAAEFIDGEGWVITIMDVRGFFRRRDYSRTAVMREAAMIDWLREEQYVFLPQGDPPNFRMWKRFLRQTRTRVEYQG